VTRYIFRDIGVGEASSSWNDLGSDRFDIS